MSLKIDISVCRVCCKSEAPHSILKYAKKFHYCTSIEVSQNDGLPDKICEGCLERMQLAVDFKRKSEFSDRQLKSFIANVNNQFMALECSGSDSLDCDDEEIAHIPDEGNENLQQAAVVAIAKNSALGFCSSESVEPESDGEKVATPEPDSKTTIREVAVLSSPTPEPDPDPAPEPEQEQEKFRAVAVIQEKPAIKPEKELYEVVEVEFDENFLQEDNVMEVEEEQQQGQPTSSTNGSESGDVSEQVIYIGYTTEYQNQEEDDDDDTHNTETADDSSEKREQFSVKVKDAYRQEEFVLAGMNPGTSLAETTSADAKLESAKFECLECNKSFSTKTNLNRHVQSHNGNKPFVCPLCNKGFTQGGSLKQHLLIHQNLRPFVCTVCDQAFTQQKSLTFHMRRHTNEKPFVCPHCAYAFRQKDGLKRHLLVKHTENDAKLFDCDLCGKAFKTRYALSMHRKRHEAGVASVSSVRANKVGDTDSSGESVDVKPEVVN